MYGIIGGLVFLACLGNALYMGCQNLDRQALERESKAMVSTDEATQQGGGEGTLTPNNPLEIQAV